MNAIRNISAALFGMDGTLVDSEILTEPSIEALCREFGVDDVGLDCTAFYGVAWLKIERDLIDLHPALNSRMGLADRLHEIYHEMLVADPPPLITKSRESVVAANRAMPTAIVSSPPQPGERARHTCVRDPERLESAETEYGNQGHQAPDPDRLRSKPDRRDNETGPERNHVAPARHRRGERRRAETAQHPDRMYQHLTSIVERHGLQKHLQELFRSGRHGPQLHFCCS